MENLFIKFKKFDRLLDLNLLVLIEYNSDLRQYQAKN